MINRYIFNDANPPDLDEAWSLAENAAKLWAKDANLWSISVARSLSAEGEKVIYYADVESFSHREPEGPPAVRTELEADGENPVAALIALIATMEANP